MVVDASVIVSGLVRHDANHHASARWLEAHLAADGLVVAPTLLLAEVAGAIARRTSAPQAARHAVGSLVRLPGLRLVAIDERLGNAAAAIAARLRLRGADALYIATAEMLRLPLVTFDMEQRERGAGVIDLIVPAVS
jgi:predicted nucleic acid-binding protein